MAVTRKQIAQEAGVSPAIVSRLLRNDPELQITEACRRRVLDVVDRYGGRRAFFKHERIAYPRNASAWSKTVRDEALRSQFSVHFRSRLGELGFCVEMVFFRPGEEVDVIRSLCFRRSEYRAILLGEGLPESCLAPICGTCRFPHVTFGHYPDSLRLNTIMPDAGGGIGRAVEHLVALGHRRIGYLGQRTIARFPMLIQAMAEMSVPIDRSLFCFLPNRPPGEGQPVWRAISRETFRGWFDASTAPTAIVCGNDYIAYGAIDVLESRGVKVGADIALVGYDNSEVWEGLGEGEPILTTVDRSHAVAGRRAAELLVNQIIYEQDQIVHELIPTKFIVRKSAGPCPLQVPGVTTEDQLRENVRL